MKQNHDFIFLFLVLIVELHDRNGNIGKKLMYIVALYAFIFENAFTFKIPLYFDSCKSFLYIYIYIYIYMQYIYIYIYIYIYTINIQYIYIYIYTIDIYTIYIYNKHFIAARHLFKILCHK